KNSNFRIGQISETRRRRSLKIHGRGTVDIFTQEPRNRTIGVNEDYGPPSQSQEPLYRLRESYEFINTAAVNELHAGQKARHDGWKEYEGICSLRRCTP